MAIGETAKLLASLELQDKFTPALKNANRALGRFDAKLADTGSRGYKAGQQIGTGLKNVGTLAVAGVGILAANVALGVDSLIKLEQAQAQTAAVLKSTGGAAGVTGEQVTALAEKFENLNAIVGDEFIRAGENMLLTFTNIKGKAFEPALQAVLDMNTAMGKGPEGLTSTAIQMGKALNDPTKGLTALSRVGVTFTKEQAKRIKALQKEGKLYEAQQVILAELNKEFGGSFAAQGDTTAGKVAKFTDAIEDLQRALATALLPVIKNVADALSEFLSDPQTVRDFEDLGKSIAQLFSPANIRAGIDALKDGFTFLKGIAGPIADVIGTAVKAFTSLPPDIQKLLVGGFAVNKLTGGLVTNIAGGIFGALKAMTVQAGVVNVTGGVVNGPGGVPGGATPGGGGTVAALLKGFALTAGVIVAAEFVKAGLDPVNDPKHQNPQGQTTKFGGTTMRGTNDVVEKLRNINAGIAGLRERAAAGDVIAQRQLSALLAQKALLESFKPTGDSGLKGKQADDRSWADIVANTKDTSMQIIASRERTLVATDGTTSAVKDTKDAVGTAKLAIDGAKRATEIGSSSVASAIRNKDLSVELNNKTVVTVNVSATGVKTTTTYQNRVGKSTGSHGGGSTGHAPGTGPLQ